MEGVKKALVLAPHPDDGEFGAGATIKKLTESGVEVWYAAFTPCIKSVPEGFPDDVLYKELDVAVSHLGIPKERIIKFHFEVRELQKNRQEILEEMIVLRKKINPDLVLLPNSQDVHQDHETIHKEGVRAFKRSKILGYELPWNNYTQHTQMHVAIEKHHLSAKIAAGGAYESQKFRTYANEEFFFSLAKMRGVQAGIDLAEAFELIHWNWI